MFLLRVLLCVMAVALVAQEGVLVGAIRGKGNEGIPKAREHASESISPAKGSGVPPCLAAPAVSV